MDLKISTTPSIIGINRTPGKLEMLQPKADMEIHTEHAKIEILTEQIRVQIDQRIPFAEAGLKNYLESTKEYAELGKRKAMEGISRIVDQGNAFIEIQNIEANPVAQQAEQNAFHWNDAEFNFDMIPKTRPQIDFIGGNVDIQIHEGKSNIKTQANMPKINYERGNIEIYLKQKNSIKIDFVGKGIDAKI